jgi:hypothetical protein
MGHGAGPDRNKRLMQVSHLHELGIHLVKARRDEQLQILIQVSIRQAYRTRFVVDAGRLGAHRGRIGAS